MRDPTKPIGIYYADEQADGSWLFGVGPDDFQLLAQGYGCMNCLEVFRLGETLVQLTKCPTCGARVEPDVLPLPGDWADYLKERQEMLDTPAVPRKPRRRRA